MLEFPSGDSPVFRDKGLQGKRMYRNVHNSGAKPGVFEPKKGGLRTAIGSCPVRVWVKHGAESGESRLRTGRCGGWQKGRLEPGLGCLRTAFDLRPPHVSPELGSPFLFSFPLPDTHNGRPPGRLYPTKHPQKGRKTPKKGRKSHPARLKS